MMTALQIVAVSLFMLLASSSVNAKRDVSLKMLFPVFRHGSRAPVTLIPNDPNNEFWNKIGLGELTNVGKYEQYINGQITKNKYKSIFRKCANSSLGIYIQSTTIPRAVMSGQCFAAGIYTPVGDQKWTTELIGQIWQPIPVYTVFELLPSSMAEFSKQFNQIILNANYSEDDMVALKAIGDATGLTIEKDLVTIVSYIDALICETYINLKLPFGLGKYASYYPPIMNNVFNSLDILFYKAVAGVLLGQVIDEIESYNNGSTNSCVNVFSLHDLHVAAVMTALSDRIFGEPPFSSTIFLELYRPDDEMGTDYFKLFYRPNITTEPTEFYIQNCGYKCPYDKFKELVNGFKSANAPT